MGLFGRKWNGQAIREAGNAPMPVPDALAFMNAPDLMGAPTAGDTYEDPRGPMQMPARKPGFFGHGGFGRILAGGIGDALQRNAGGEATYAAMQHENMRQRLMAQQAEQARQQEWDDYVRKQEYERANPKAPSPNDTERDYEFIRQTAGEEAAKQWLQNRYDPIVNVPLPDGVYLGPRSEMARLAKPQAAPQPKPEAIDYLRRNPNLKAEFDAKYGQGAADRVLGGQAAPPPATFP